MSMEITVMDGESEDAVLAGTKRAFNPRLGAALNKEDERR